MAIGRSPDSWRLLRSTARLPLIPLPVSAFPALFAVPSEWAGGPVLFRLVPGRTYCTGCASHVIRPPRIYHIPGPGRTTFTGCASQAIRPPASAPSFDRAGRGTIHLVGPRLASEPPALLSQIQDSPNSACLRLPDSQIIWILRSSERLIEPDYLYRGQSARSGLISILVLCCYA